MRTILVVEDEIPISRVLKAYLQKAGFEVDHAFTGVEAIDRFGISRPDLVLLDVMLPDQDGWTVLRRIREMGACPVIMLTALSDMDHKLSGLNDGADDYMTKPFVADEVVARVQAVLRRSTQVMDHGESRSFGDLRVDFRAHSVSLHGIELELTPRDLALVIFLARNPNQTFTRDQLIEGVWGMDYDGSDRAVDLAVKRIRRVLENWPESQGEIRTLRGLGYQLCAHEK